MSEEVRQCVGKNGCGEFKPLSEFIVQKSGARPGYVFPNCKKCHIKRNSGWLAENEHCRTCGERIDRRGYDCKKCFNVAYIGSYVVMELDGTLRPMTEADYDRMLDEQDGKCAICGTTNFNGPGSTSTHRARFDIDHCHDSGIVRALCCMQCNVGLGCFKDDIERVKSAAAYLEAHSKRVSSYRRTA